MVWSEILKSKLSHKAVNKILLEVDKETIKNEKVENDG